MNITQEEFDAAIQKAENRGYALGYKDGFEDGFDYEEYDSSR